MTDPSPPPDRNDALRFSGRLSGTTIAALVALASGGALVVGSAPAIDLPWPAIEAGLRTLVEASPWAATCAIMFVITARNARDQEARCREDTSKCRKEIEDARDEFHRDRTQLVADLNRALDDARAIRDARVEDVRMVTTALHSTCDAMARAVTEFSGEVKRMREALEREAGA